MEQTSKITDGYMKEKEKNYDRSEKGIVYRKIEAKELNRDLFAQFERHQVVGKCWRYVNEEWVIQDDPFIDQWSEEDYAFLVKCLKHTIETGGLLDGAFVDGILKGFVSVESEPLGKKKNYLDLSCIHVSEEMRGHGIGRTLFLMAAAWAKEHGGEKLYISAHSAVETQAFYRSLGCVEAEEYNEEHVKQEPYDCQMEYIL